jgi:hypothetical protein
VRVRKRDREEGRRKGGREEVRELGRERVDSNKTQMNHEHRNHNLDSIMIPQKLHTAGSLNSVDTSMSTACCQANAGHSCAVLCRAEICWCLMIDHTRHTQPSSLSSGGLVFMCRRPSVIS